MAARQPEAGFIPTRHGAGRAQAEALLGVLRWLLPRDAAPDAAEWQAMGEALMQGDPPMDALVAWMSGVGMKTARPLFERALVQGIATLPDAPEPLRAFFAAVETPPDWLDASRLEAGAAVIGLGGMDYFLVNRDFALMGGYQASAFNKTLLLTGALQKGALRRVAETVQWYLDCTGPGAMRRGGAGYQSTLRVRLIHALVRRHVAGLPAWKMQDWGLPVNQLDMAATALAFPTLLLVGGRAMGVLVSLAESRAAMHHGRYVGWLMGVDPRWLPHTEGEGLKRLYQFALSISNPDETSVQLAQALAREPLQRPYPRWKAHYHHARHLSVSRLFLGRTGMRNLGLTAGTLPWYPLLRLPFNVLRHTVSFALPGARARMARNGRQQVIDYLREITSGEDAQVGGAADRLHSST